MKVLIISHTALNTHNNMGKTMLSLFSSFEREELCHLFVYPMLPDVDKCASHYRITDKDVLKSYFKFKVRGQKIDPSMIDTSRHQLFENGSDAKIYRNRKNKTAFRVLARDLMWKFARWYTKELDTWINEQKPTCIFVAPGNPKFLYDIAIKIAKKYSLPMVVYICDDFYFTANGEKSAPLMKRLHTALLQRKTRKLFENSQHIVTICDELAECYSKEFSLPATTVMTGTNYEIAKDVKKTPVIDRLTYMGNIRYNRYLCLCEIGRALDRFNEEEGTDCTLEIYSVEKDKEILSSFQNIKSIKFCGFVGGEEFDKVFFNSQMFIHTEAFDDVNVNLTKRSVSTKIADCLGSGIPVFAYAPENIASMGHLMRNDAAICATKAEELYEKLSFALKNPDERNRVAENALAAAKRFHIAQKQSEILKVLIEEVL